jgi:hypothetical protein
VFSYVDLVRGEIPLEVGERFGVTIPDEETDGWRTLSDVAQSVVERAGGTATEPEVIDRVRVLLAEGDSASAALKAEDEIFGDYDQAVAWFMAPPYPHRLGDRWFAKRRGGPAEPS